jgi:flagellar basal-body rod protein FlgB
MYFTTLTDRGATPALVQSASFQESRLRVIATNLANMSTPNYRAQQLDTKIFQRALRDALDRRGGDIGRPLSLKGGDQVRTDPWGNLRTTPTERPVDNLLFHDGTNQSIEREMADLAETGAAHELATSLLRQKWDGIRRAIRGTAA